MDSREDVRESIRAIRRSKPGLTIGTLTEQTTLLRLLGTDDPQEGLDLLRASVDELTQTENSAERDDALGLRAALGIGLPALKNATARREAARKDAIFVGERRTQYDAENRAIERLVDLLIKEAVERKTDAFDAASNQSWSVDDPEDFDAEAESNTHHPVEKPPSFAHLVRRPLEEYLDRFDWSQEHLTPVERLIFWSIMIGLPTLAGAIGMYVGLMAFHRLL